MTKKEFYALPVPPTPEMDVPQYLERVWPYDPDKRLYRYSNRKYTARMVEKMLEITVYDAQTGAPLWRTWQDSDRVFGQTLGEKPTPSEATIHSRMDGYPREWYGAPGADELIQGWVHRQYWQDEPGDLLPIYLAAWSQTKIRHKKRDEKWDRIRREIDNAMLEIREPVKDFYRWVTRDALREGHYLVYQYQKRKEKAPAFCTRCGHWVDVKDPRNRKPGKCPRCRAELTCISEKTLGATNGYTASKIVAYMQPTREGFCLRKFRVSIKITGENYKGAQVEYSERNRYFYNMATGHITKSFTYGQFYTADEIRWCRDHSEPYGTAQIYPGNLKKLFAGTDWQYVPMAELARHCGEINLDSFIRRTRGNLGLEHLAKHGLWRLAADRIYSLPGYLKGNFESARSIREAMNGMPMDQIRLMMQANPDEKELAVYRIASGREKVDLETLRRMIAMGLQTDREVTTKILKHTTCHRAIRYIETQKAGYPDVNRYDYEKRVYRDMPVEAIVIARDWRDYLRDAEFLGWDLTNDFVLFPKDLRAAHQRSIQMTERKENEKLYGRVAEIVKEQEIFSWETKEYLIRPPVSGEEIVAEGQELHHCVGSYIEAVADGRSIILFVRDREKPEKPLVTVEIDPKDWRVRQARGSRNNAPPEGVQKFLEKWKKHLEKVKEARERERVRIA